MKLRKFSQRMTPEELADLEERGINRPFQWKNCSSCGKKFRTCAGGRINCIACSPITLGRQVSIPMKEAIQDYIDLKVGDAVINSVAPPEEIFAAQEFLRTDPLDPKNSKEAITLLGKVMGFMARGALHPVRGNALIRAIQTQIGMLRDDDRRVDREKAEKKRSLLEEKKEKRRAEAARKKEEEQARKLEEKRSGKSSSVGVPLPEMTEQDRRLAGLGSEGGRE